MIVDCRVKWQKAPQSVIQGNNKSKFFAFADRFTLTVFWPKRIIKFRDALFSKAIAVFIFGDNIAILTFHSFDNASFAL